MCQANIPKLFWNATPLTTKIDMIKSYCMAVVLKLQSHWAEDIKLFRKVHGPPGSGKVQSSINSGLNTNMKTEIF